MKSRPPKQELVLECPREERSVLALKVQTYPYNIQKKKEKFQPPCHDKMMPVSLSVV